MNKKITTIDELAVMINKSFEGIELRMAKQEDLLALTARVDHIEKRGGGFKKYVEGRFDELFRDIKDIKNQIKAVDTRAEVVNLEFRVDTIERELKLTA